MNSTASYRNEYADLLKGLLMFGVITTHAAGSLSAPHDPHVHMGVVWYSMLPWIMPLFMAISGFFFYRSVRKRNTKELLVSRILHLLIPTLSWIYIGKLFSFVSHINKPLADFSWWPCGYWFLWSLMACVVITMIIFQVGKYTNEKNEYIFAVFIGCMLCMIPEKLWHVAAMFIFFYGGYLCCRFFKYNFLNIWHYLFLLLFSIGCWIFSTYTGYGCLWYHWDSGSYIFGPLGWKTHVFYNVYRAVLGISGSVGFAGVVYSLWKKSSTIRNHKAVSAIILFFVKMGKLSLEMYLIQGFVVEMLALRIVASLGFRFGNPLVANIYVFKWLLAPAGAVAFSLICLFICRCIQRFPILSKLLLGK